MASAVKVMAMVVVAVVVTMVGPMSIFFVTWWSEPSRKRPTTMPVVRMVPVFMTFSVVWPEPGGKGPLITILIFKVITLEIPEAIILSIVVMVVWHT